MSRVILENIIADFSPEKFVRFFREKSNKFAPRQENFIQYNDDNFKDGKKLGEITFAEAEQLAVFAFRANQPLSERSGKKAQYEKGKKILKDRQYDAGIFIFYDTQGNFRFSLIYANYLGKKRDWSVFRRFTYFVSKEFTNKTFLQRIGDGDFSSLEKIKDAFSVEKVTKEFYLEYRKLFESLLGELSKNHTFLNEAAKHGLNAENFAKKLLGQIVFLYFLQRKGWLGAPRDKYLNEGDKNFISNLFKAKYREYNNFFNDILEPLFYGALNKKSDKAGNFYRDYFKCQIPFLNGGLFESEYKWEETIICFDNNIFKNILEVFNRYNFTVEEESPDDKEIAVDPEMLGKVFESLLEANLRKNKGTYYTPREIVHYMCQESLINYLVTESKIAEKKIRNLVTKNIVLIKEKEADKLDEILKNIKVVDPACGSGAFLVGMLQEITKARQALRSFNNKEFNEYHFRKETIQNCIYGVDIDPGAVEIAKLRLWLSLIVDYELEEIEPLPNLDYKVMQGNSLLEELVLGDTTIKLFDPDLLKKGEKKMKNLFEEEKQKDLFENQSIITKTIHRLDSLHRTYFEISDLSEKLKVKKEIEKIEEMLVKECVDREIKTLDVQLKNIGKYITPGVGLTHKDAEKMAKTISIQAGIMQMWQEFRETGIRPFFLWHLYFADVFQEKGGFDVVIANPPWISNDNIDEKDKEIFKRNYIIARSRFDLANLFVEQSLNLLRTNGWMFFVIPEHIWLGDYFIPFRKYLASNTTILEIISSKETSFMSVSNPSSIFLAQNKKKTTDNHILELGTFYSGDFPLKFETANGIENRIIFNEFMQGLNEKINNSGFKSIGEIALVTDGIQTANLLHTIFTKEPDEKKKYHKALRSGKEIKFRYARIEWTGWWVLKPENTRNFKRPGFSYDSPKRMSCFTAKEKIILRQTEPTILATLDVDKYYFPNSIFQITFEKDEPKKLRWLLGLLNSRFLRYFYGKLAQVEGTTKPQMYINILKALPIPDGAMPDISGIVDEILVMTKESDYVANSEKQAKVKEYERQIDQMIYRLYDLTPEEIKIIENFTIH